MVHFVHDDVIKWKHFPRYWPFVRRIHRSPVNSPHKGQWRGALMFSLMCARINNWVNNREAGDLRRYRHHYDVIVMLHIRYVQGQGTPYNLRSQRQVCVTRCGRRTHDPWYDTIDSVSQRVNAMRHRGQAKKSRLHGAWHCYTDRPATRLNSHPVDRWRLLQ